MLEALLERNSMWLYCISIRIRYTVCSLSRYNYNAILTLFTRSDSDYISHFFFSILLSLELMIIYKHLVVVTVLPVVFTIRLHVGVCINISPMCVANSISLEIAERKS